MNKYTIELKNGRAGDRIQMNNIKCSSDEVADQLSEALAALLPESTYYCQKNSREIEAAWYGMAERSTDA